MKKKGADRSSRETRRSRPATTAWLSEPLPSDVRVRIERLQQLDDVRRIAVMPDVHLSQEFCVGTVVASEHFLYPRAVGSDIGCGMLALRFDACAQQVLANDEDAHRLLRSLALLVPSIKHSRFTLPALEIARNSPLFSQRTLSHRSLERYAARDGRVQFATLGRGNHFVEFQQDEVGDLWLMLHSGSRAMGQRISEFHLAQCETSHGFMRLDAETQKGKNYLNDVAWARAYAAASRLGMADAVCAILEEQHGIVAAGESLIHCDHNHLQREVHRGESFWVHRKGALSAQPGEPGVIPGSMGSASYHVQGRGEPSSMCSSSHGAGRRLSRSAARQQISTRELERQTRGVWWNHALSQQLREEAPGCYKEIDRVMRAQRTLTKIVRRLQPCLSYKGT